MQGCDPRDTGSSPVSLTKFGEDMKRLMDIKREVLEEFVVEIEIDPDATHEQIHQAVWLAAERAKPAGGGREVVFFDWQEA